MGSILLLLTAAELLLRVLPGTSVSLALDVGRGADQIRKDLLQRDEQLGYRPVLGGSLYGPHGALWNEYHLEKPTGIRRLLFLGDSVTRRGRIIESLRSQIGSESYEYWNAGVEGFSTRQELEYYRRFLADIHADHVILTFCLNDFENSPVFFRDGPDYVHFVNRRAFVLQPWLFEHSYLYRLMVRLRQDASREEAIRVTEAQVEGALRDMAALVADRGARFTVLVAPWCQPPERWDLSLEEHHQRVVSLLQQLHVPHYTFMQTLERLAEAGASLSETPVDLTHPSAELGAAIAADLLRSGFDP